MSSWLRKSVDLISWMKILISTIAEFNFPTCSTVEMMLGLESLYFGPSFSDFHFLYPLQQLSKSNVNSLDFAAFAFRFVKICPDLLYVREFEFDKYFCKIGILVLSFHALNFTDLTVAHFHQILLIDCSAASILALHNRILDHQIQKCFAVAGHLSLIQIVLNAHFFMNSDTVLYQLEF